MYPLPFFKDFIIFHLEQQNVLQYYLNLAVFAFFLPPFPHSLGYDADGRAPRCAQRDEFQRRHERLQRALALGAGALRGDAAATLGSWRGELGRKKYVVLTKWLNGNSKVVTSRSLDVSFVLTWFCGFLFDLHWSGIWRLWARPWWRPLASAITGRNLCTSLRCWAQWVKPLATPWPRHCNERPSGSWCWIYWSRWRLEEVEPVGCGWHVLASRA